MQPASDLAFGAGTRRSREIKNSSSLPGRRKVYVGGQNEPDLTELWWPAAVEMPWAGCSVEEPLTEQDIPHLQQLGRQRSEQMRWSERPNQMTVESSTAEAERMAG